MLTLESKFADYVESLRRCGACEPVVAEHDKMLAEHKDFTIGDLGKLFASDPKFDSGWAFWVLKLMGKEMASDFREATIDLIRVPMMCLKLYYECAFFSEAEKSLLRTKYDGQGEEIAKAVICCDAIAKSRAFNAVRVEAVTTCKSVTEAKALIELKTDVVTTVSADSAVKSADEIKNILEAERTKVTLATNEVMRSQGFVDGNGNGSVSVFESWLEGA